MKSLPIIFVAIFAIAAFATTASAGNGCNGGFQSALQFEIPGQQFQFQTAPQRFEIRQSQPRFQVRQLSNRGFQSSFNFNDNRGFQSSFNFNSRSPRIEIRRGILGSRVFIR